MFFAEGIKRFFKSNTTSTLPLSDDVHARVEALFPGPLQTQAEDLLVQELGIKLFGGNSTPNWPLVRQTRYSALKFSAGDLEKLRLGTELAQTDPRELIQAAGMYDRGEFKWEDWFP